MPSVRSERALLIYDVVETVHSPEHDLGTARDAIGFAWPSESPRLSDRDRSFPSLSTFAGPF